MSRSRDRSSLQHKFLTLGMVLMLCGILLVIAVVSITLSMRFAVRGTEIEVPDLVGMAEAEAVRSLHEAGLQLEVRERRYYLSVREGAVAWQSPHPGGRIKAGRSVQTIISLGRRRNPVPNLVGSTLRASRTLLRQSGYQLGNITEIVVPGTKREQVIQQFPGPDAERVVDPRIDVLVSSEDRAEYIMPNVIGQSLNRVSPFFQDNGFQLSQIRYRPARGTRRGLVVKQYPDPGYRLTESDRIYLEVAR